MNSNINTGSRAPLPVSLVVVLACVFGASSAFADDPVRAETVRFPDLNVNSSQGVQALYRRIHAAAWRVCDTTSGDLLFQRAARDCAKRAEAKAIETVDLPQLTAFYRMKTGGGTQPLSANR